MLKEEYHVFTQRFLIHPEPILKAIYTNLSDAKKCVDEFVDQENPEVEMDYSYSEYEQCWHWENQYFMIYIEKRFREISE